jgi:hypothetical protein
VNRTGERKNRGHCRVQKSAKTVDRGNMQTTACPGVSPERNETWPDTNRGTVRVKGPLEREMTAFGRVRELGAGEVAVLRRVVLKA